MSQRELPDVPPEVGATLAWPQPDAVAAISAFVDQGPFGVAVVDTDLRFLLVSRGLALLHGQEAAQTVGRRVDEVLPAPLADHVARRLRQVLESGVPVVDAETRGTFDDPGAARSFTFSFYRLAASSGEAVGVVILITEMTELRSAAAAAAAAGAQLDLLQRITGALSGGGDQADVTRATLEGAAHVLGASAGVLVERAAESDIVVALASVGLADGTLATLQEPVSSDVPLPHCDTLRSHTLNLWRSRAERDAQYPELASRSADHQAWAFVPIEIHEQVIGVAAFAWRLDRDFSDADTSLLHAVARQCALALEQARILDAEHDARRGMEFLVEVTRFIVESSDEGVIAMSAGNRILTCNRRFSELMGLADGAVEVGADAAALLGQCLAGAADPAGVAQHLATSRAQAFGPSAFDFELVDGTVLAWTSSPIVDRHNAALGRVWYIRDETQQRAREARQRHSIHQLQVSHEHQAFLLQAAEVVSQADGYAETLERLAAVAVPTLADLCLVDTLTWDGHIVRMAAKHADADRQDLVDELGSKYAPDPEGDHPSIEVMHTGRVRWSATMSDEFLRKTSRDENHFALLKRLEFTSYMALPLVADNRILGSITLVSAGSGRRFGPDDLTLADDFTSCVAQVVATTHRNDAARHAAHTLQASLLPADLPEVPGLSFAVRYLPATLDNDVGGDFYDVITSPTGGATVVIGDVAGHDMQAAAVMGKVRTAVRVLSNQATGPGHFLEMLRHGWDNLELERITTLLVADVDTATGALRMASAGHPPPLLVGRRGATFVDVKPTTPLGAPRSAIHEWRGSLAPGDTLLFYTDGLIEDRHRTFEDGATKLTAAARGGRDPNALCDRVLASMVKDEHHHDDDIALIALALRGGHPLA